MKKSDYFAGTIIWLWIAIVFKAVCGIEMVNWEVKIGSPAMLLTGFGLLFALLMKIIKDMDHGKRQ